MRGRLFVLISFLTLLACSEEELPVGIYHYQVERLLSGEEGSKVWMKVVNSQNCSDSVQLIFELVENTSDDSLDISIISGCPSMNTATIIGRASASKAEDRDLFTDSLIFASGNFWIINQITSQQLFLNMNDQDVQYMVK
ncbi:hypothetical protein [Ekhidna sp. To15]|uniref:hypothetical protein n=1 Tax=Ekhidna sp. To15 TaxID=3395267 RepID=UPI003F525F2B